MEPFVARIRQVPNSDYTLPNGASDQEPLSVRLTFGYEADRDAKRCEGTRPADG